MVRSARYTWRMTAFLTDTSTANQILARTGAYRLELTTAAADIAAAQRLRYRVFVSEPGYESAMANVIDGRDADRFDEFCDHLIVRHTASDASRGTAEVIGCYRMLPPPGAIAAGGLYTATEFDLAELDPIAPQLVEMGRATVAVGHRSGSVLALMWAGIMRYLDVTGYRYLAGCTSVPILTDPADVPGAQVRGLRDHVRDRHQGPWQVYPHRHVELDGLRLDDIEPPRILKFPPLLRGYIRMGAVICGEPGHDSDFGVADFVTVLDRRTANERYVDRLRTAALAAERGF